MEIRLANGTDAEAIQALYAPIVERTAISFELSAPTVDQMRSRMLSTLEELPWLVCEERGETLGYAYAARFRPRPAYRWTVEVSVYVHPRQQRRGVGLALYSSLLACLRCMGYRNALAVIALPNPPSVALHERVGFQPVGVFHKSGFKLGAWHDVGWWELTLREQQNPDVPRALSDSRGDVGLQEAIRSGAALVRPCPSG